MKRQMEKSTSIDKNKETASHESEIQVYDYIKSKSQLEQRSQKLNQEFKKSEQYLEYLTKEQKEIKEKIKHHFSANKDVKIRFFASFNSCARSNSIFKSLLSEK